MPAERTDLFPLGTPLRTMNDTAFDALANEHRRTLLVDLLEDNPQDATAYIPVDGDPGGLKTEQRSQSAMYHTHQPKLDEYGYIHWNRDTNEIVKGPRFEELQPLLEAVAPHARR